MNITKNTNKKLKVIASDISRGFYANRYRYIIIIFLIVGIFFAFGNREFGMLDEVFLLQGGTDPIVISKDGKFVFPYIWMLGQFLVPFMVYSYCNDDSEGFGMQFLMKCKSKALWWNSKCIWSVFTVISVYFIEYVIAFITGCCNGNRSFSVNYEMFKKISNKSLPDNMDSMYILIYLLIMPVVVSIVIALVQMTISIFTNPMIGMVIVLSWDVMSVFINNVLMIGNNSMVVRSAVYNESRIDVWKSIGICIFVYIVIYLIGIIKFKKRDFLSKED